MNRLIARYRIVTPMFLAGADQTDPAELRPPSVKGMLRFWWRALMLAEVKGNIPELNRQESELFGSTERGSSIQLQIEFDKKVTKHNISSIYTGFTQPNRPGARYLAFGLMDAFSGQNTTAGKLQRACIDPNQFFYLHCLSRTTIPDSFIKALKLLGLLGGLGSRSRKGLGSLTLESLTLNGESKWTKPCQIDVLKTNIEDLLKNASNYKTFPEFSAFSQYTRVDYLGEKQDPLALLDQYGRQMQRYRSWGKEGLVNHQDREENFKPDHDWYRQATAERDQNYHPQRVVFGLPHNYDSKRADGIVEGVNHERRASPLFFHIHALSDGKFAGISLLLPARFLPANETINAGGNPVEQNIQWQVLNEFLDGFEGHKDNKTESHYFPNKAPWIKGRPVT